MVGWMRRFGKNFVLMRGFELFDDLGVCS